MKSKIVLTLLLFIGVLSNAQNPEQALKANVAQWPIEKIYLQFDRENYAAGEIGWFKAYLSSDHLPDTISTSLYVDLIGPAAAVISKNVFPVVLGTTSGQIDLPDSLSSGIYLIRAYTATMLNQHPDFVYQRKLAVYGKNKFQQGDLTAKTKIEFFPEGGNMVSGFKNTIAFKVTNAGGLPVESTGKLRNEKGEEKGTFSTYHDGMGMFDLEVKPGEKYFAQLDIEAGQTFELPVPVTKGIVLSLIPHPQGSYYDIQQNGQDPVFQSAYMIGQMQHHVVFRQEFKPGLPAHQGLINTQSLRSGILQVTVFNKDGLPLAERICFVNNREYIQEGELFTDTLNFSAKAKNRFRLSLKDTVRGNFSISVTDATYSTGPREENIFSSLLLTSDIRGYVHKPAYYFSSNNDSVSNALDLLMMTHGWRRFNWNDLQKNNVTQGKYNDAKFITLAGKVTLRDTRKPFAQKPLLMMILHADSTRTIQMITTDKSGEFKVDSLLFYGPSRILVSDVRGKKNQFIDIHLTADSLNRSFVLGTPMTFPRDTAVAFNKRMDDNYDEVLKASGLLLQGITVKAKKKTPLQELEEKYAKGMFSGMSERTIDLVNTDEVVTHLNIFDYLQYRVPGLTVSTDGIDYSITYRQTASISSMGLMPMTLFLDEIETDASVIATIPGNQVAMVKVFANFVGAVGNGAGGALAIYTKKDADVNMAMSSADLVRYKGYSVIKEFYAPNYLLNPEEKNKPDKRVTLEWRPVIFVSSVDPVIPFTFYNNDITREFKVVIEGMTSDGKLIMIEKKIGAKAGF